MQRKPAAAMGEAIPKQWSYLTVTEVAERRIRVLMERAKNFPPETEEARIRRDWAYGVFLGWESLTGGWRQQGDSERLEALTKVEGDQKHGKREVK